MPRVVQCRPWACLELAWNALMSVPAERDMARQFNLSPDAFFRRHEGSDLFLAIEVCGSLAGCAWFRGREMHLAVLPAYRGRWFPALPEILALAFRSQGQPLTARVNRRNALARRFVEQVGCELTEESEASVRYTITPNKMRFRKVRHV